jgi:hypothetical protein
MFTKLMISTFIFCMHSTAQTSSPKQHNPYDVPAISHEDLPALYESTNTIQPPLREEIIFHVPPANVLPVNITTAYMQAIQTPPSYVRPPSYQNSIVPKPIPHEQSLTSFRQKRQLPSELAVMPEFPAETIIINSIKKILADWDADPNIRNFNLIETACKTIQPDLLEKALANQMGTRTIAKMIHRFLKAGNTPAMQTVESKKKIFILINLVKNTPLAELNQINPVDGQAIIHKFTPFHWNLDLINQLQIKGVDFTLRTTHPDRHPGSTIASNIAGGLRAKNYDIACFYQKNALEFLKNCITRYPKILTFKSALASTNPAFADNGERIFCWNLIPPHFRPIIKSQLTNETKKRIFTTIVLQKIQGEISEDDCTQLINDVLN